jgi:predicted Zn-dependent protease
VLAASIIVSACAAPSRVSRETLLSLAEREEAALLKRVTVYPDPELTRYLRRLAERLSPSSGVRVTVIEDPTLAAFAMPGGHLFVHTGLLSVVEDEGQLAAILARELAHDASGIVPGVVRVPIAPVALGPTAAALFRLDLQLAIAAAVEGRGRDEERHADRESVRRLAAAGYDPAEATLVFLRLADHGADRAGLAEILFYGDGQRLGERAEFVRGLIGERRPAPAGRDPAATDEFARRVRPVVRDNARLDVHAGRFALARRQLDRVLADDPGDATAHLYRGELHRLQAQRAVGSARAEAVQRAVEHFRRALELGPGSAEPLRQLALLHYQQGDVAGARAAFERYLAIAPNAPDAQRIRRYLAIMKG